MSRHLPDGQRVLDLVLVAVLLPVLAIPALLIGLAVFLDTPGPIFYRSTRVGRWGEPFQMLKLRTMRHGQPGESLSAGGDERITWIGRTLRKSRLDELPQLWNVIRGQMSLVGPRPELAEFVAEFGDDYERILQVRPGLTGPTQVEFAGIEAHLLEGQPDRARYYAEHVLPRKVVIDLRYAETRSNRGDLRFLWATFTLGLRVLATRVVAPSFRGRFAGYAMGVGLSGVLLLTFFFAASGSPR